MAGWLLRTYSVPFAPLSSGGFSSPTAEVCTLSLCMQICKDSAAEHRRFPHCCTLVCLCRGLSGLWIRPPLAWRGGGSCRRTGGGGHQGVRLLGFFCRRPHLPLAAPGAGRGGLGAPCWEHALWEEEGCRSGCGRALGMYTALVGPALFLPEQEGCMACPRCRRAPCRGHSDTAWHGQSFVQGTPACQREFLFLLPATLPCGFCARLRGA